MITPSELSTPVSYNGAADFARPRRKLWRSLLHMARPIREFAPRLSFNPMIDAPDPESAAHWGEHMLIEDVATVLHRDGTISTLRHVVTQLHGVDHLAAWDENVRSFDSRHERHRVATARLFLPEGRWINAENRTHVVSTPGARANRNGRTIVVRFFPLRPGVIVEFEEIYDSFIVDKAGPTIANTFYLQTAPPCRRRRYTVAVAKPFRLTHRTHHWDGRPTERQIRDYHVCTWEVNEAEGLEFDEWTPPLRDFAPWVDVTTAETWKPFARRLRGELESWTHVGHDVAEVARDLGRDKTTPVEKASAAYTYVANSVRYGRPPTETQTRNSRAAEQVMRDLRGDCKDKSALLVQLLRSMKLKAHVAAVLTGDAGRTPFLPSARFNHALVRLEHDGRTYWLDAASGPFAFGDLPPIDQGIYALVMGQDGFHFELIRLANAQEPQENRSCAGRLTAEGAYEFDVTASFSGEAAARLRAQLTARIEKHCLRVLQTSLGNDFPGAVGAEFTYGSVDELAARFEYRCHAHMPRAARRIQDLYVFRVPWAGLLSLTGPMAAAERSQPLVVPMAYHVDEEHVIDLPEGVTPQAIPDPTEHACAWGQYSCRIVLVGRRLRCERRLQLAGDSFVPSQRFAEMQEFWRQCSWADRAEVVLRQD